MINNEQKIIATIGDLSKRLRRMEARERGRPSMTTSACPIVSVKSYGAVGDGLADDTASVQLAFNSSNVIYFPAGTYLCSRLTIPSNREIFGSTNAILKSTALNNKSLLRNANVDTGNTNIHIHDLKLDGNKS